jgi:hypothetical protein
MKKFYLHTVVFASMCFFGGTALAQPGTVTLTPPSGPATTHASITSAYAAIPNAPAGSYMIELQAAYTGADASEIYPITLGSKGLTPGGPTITIRPAANNNGEIIQRPTAAATGTAIILIDGGDNIIIDGRPGGVLSSAANYLTVNDVFSGSNSSRAIEMLNGANNNTVRFINANSAAATNATTGSRVIAITTSPAGGANNNNVITNNIVTGGLRGIQIFGTVENNVGNVISNNTVRDYQSIGIFGGSFQDNTTIQGNTLTFTVSPAFATSVAAIQNQGTQGTTTVCNITDNTISIPLTAATPAASATGIINIGTGNINILRNTISSITAPATQNTSVNGISSSGNNVLTVSQNTIGNLTGGPGATSTTSISVQGIAVSPGTAAHQATITRNRIFNLSAQGAGNIRGIALFAFAGSTINTNNNMVSITQPNTTASAIFGILIGQNGTNAYTSNVYFNSVRLGGQHTLGDPAAPAIGSYGILKSDANAGSTHNIKNNVAVTDRTGGPNLTTAFANTGANVGTLSIDHNVWFATASANAFAAGWGTTYYNALADYKAAASPHEQNTIFQNVNFVSATDLHLTGASLTDPNLVGTPIAGITVDFDGQTRSATAPRRGADENGAPTPVTLSSFNAFRTGAVNSINWTTSQEINTNKFVVERSSDGRNFRPIGEVAAAGTSSNTLNYKFIDQAPVKGVNFYRLKSVDIDQSFSYSDIKSVRNLVNVDIAIYPNPVHEVMKLEISSDKNDLAQLIITNMEGKQVYASRVNVAQGDNIFNINIGHLAGGSYVVKIQLSDKQEVKQFNKL